MLENLDVFLYLKSGFVHSLLVEDEPKSKFMYFLNFNYVFFFWFKIDIFFLN